MEELQLERVEDGDRTFYLVYHPEDPEWQESEIDAGLDDEDGNDD